MLRVAVCDDDPQVLEIVESVLEARSPALEWEVFSTGDALLRYQRQSGEGFHIYLLDIEMPGSNGIETAADIRRENRDAVVIFMTGHREYVYDVFQVLPFRFLEKPVGAEEVHKALDEADEHLHSAGSLFFYQAGREQRNCPCGGILYFQGEGRRVIIHTKDGEQAFYGKISSTWNTLPPGQFTRTHASFIVNLEHLASVCPADVRLKNGALVPMSKKYREQVKRAHLQYIARRNR